MNVTGSYRPSLILIGSIVAASFVLCLATVSPRPKTQRAAQALGDDFPIGRLRLNERSGRTLTEADFVNRVVVASFIFTRCPLSCPKITSVMKGLQSKFEGSNIQLLSLTVDPTHDTPAILAEYAKKFDADPKRWWFANGPADEIQDLITKRFKLGLVATTDADQQAGAEAFAHSDRLALIRDAKVVGYFDSNDPETIQSLINEAKALDKGEAPAWVRSLPAVNATLNGSCALILGVGWMFIRRQNAKAHAACMITAVIVSSLFLTCYLVYHGFVGSVPFQGSGPIRPIYYTILLSHTLLATLGVVPLVTITVWRAYRKRFHQHAAIAHWTFPIWMYVSITGVMIYVLLYHVPT